MPAAGTFYGILPFLLAELPFLCLSAFGLKTVSSPRSFGDLVGAAPEVDGEAGEIGRAERGCLKHCGTADRDLQQVGLELHEQVVRGSTAIHAKFMERRLRVFIHGPQHVCHLKRDALNRRAGDVADLCAALQAR